MRHRHRSYITMFLDCGCGPNGTCNCSNCSCSNCTCTCKGSSGGEVHFRRFCILDITLLSFKVVDVALMDPVTAPTASVLAVPAPVKETKMMTLRTRKHGFSVDL